MAGFKGSGGGPGSDTTAYHSTDAALLPASDAFQSFGSPAKRVDLIRARFLGMVAGLNDTKLAAALGLIGGVPSLGLGPGGSSVDLDFFIQRIAAGVAKIPTGAMLQIADSVVNPDDVVTKKDLPVGGGAFQLVQTIVQPADSDVLSFTGLDGDIAGSYYIHGKILAGNAGDNISLRPQGADTNCATTYALNTGAVLIAGTVAYLFATILGAIGVVSTFAGKLIATKADGLTRGGDFVGLRGIGTLNQGLNGVWSYNDNTTKITQLDVKADGASGVGIKAGSVVSLFKVTG